MSDRIDAIFDRYKAITERLAAQGPASLSKDDWQIVADVALAMRLAALGELTRLGDRTAAEAFKVEDAPAIH